LVRADGRRLHGGGGATLLRSIRGHPRHRGLRNPVPRRVPARLRRRLVAAPGPDRDRQARVLARTSRGRVRQKGDRGHPRRPRRAHDRRQDAGRRDLEAVPGDGQAGRDARAQGPGAGGGVRLHERARRRARADGGVTHAMRFFEYEAREIVKRAGIPVTDYGFTTDPAEAAAIARRIAGPTVIKSQVLSGGRMKAGGVKFADTPEQAEAHAREILALEIGGHLPRGVLVDPRAEVEQEYYAGVVWDGTRKRPVMIFSPVGGIDIEQVAEQQPEAVGRRHFSNVLPLSDFEAKEVIASSGVTGSALNQLVPILTRLARVFVENDMTLAEINPLGRLRDGSLVALDAHMEMENEARGRHAK